MLAPPRSLLHSALLSPLLFPCTDGASHLHLGLEQEGNHRLGPDGPLLGIGEPGHVAPLEDGVAVGVRGADQPIGTVAERGGGKREREREKQEEKRR